MICAYSVSDFSDNVCLPTTQTCIVIVVNNVFVLQYLLSHKFADWERERIFKCFQQGLYVCHHVDQQYPFEFCCTSNASIQECSKYA